MSQDEWAATIARTVGREVRRYRDQQGLSAEQLAQKCTSAGLPMKRPVIANLESGRRPTVSLAELLILGKVLEVPPLLLVFPVGRDEMTEVVPGREVPTWLAAKWFTGEEPLPWKTPDGWAVSPEDWGAWQDGAEPVDRFRTHDRYISEWEGARGRAAAARDAARAAQGDAERDAFLMAAQAEEQQARFIERSMQENRAGMRRAGLKPHPLAPLLAHLDEERP
ncbi:helix-turn-helix domain-containing protein [Nocardiopsis dassonvillei]|uniref:helix-turn-helix domain-containing protein n=1 Tax=Nocardiopsis dassonvillei TaxID=2014 RepID=UPI0036303AEE